MVQHQHLIIVVNLLSLCNFLPPSCQSSVEQTIPSPGPDQPTQPGIINLLQLEKPIQRNHADLIKPTDLRGDPSDKAQARKLRKKPTGLDSSAVVSISLFIHSFIHSFSQQACNASNIMLQACWLANAVCYNLIYN